MAGPTVGTDFLAVVRRSGLIEEARLRELFPDDGSVPHDPQRAATVLLRAGLVTGFQAKQLLAGKFRGFILGTYKILEPIGKGGMGTVFLAEHASLKRKVALKVLPADKATEHLSLERFQREARSAAALDHPNIVRLHDISQGSGVHFLVMEYVEGNDLQSLMAKTGPLHYVQAAQYVAQAALGLQHAHDKGFVHRDIKPANLILSRDGNIKILDMGLTRSLTEDADNLTGNLGDASDVAGTADYISPEQALQQSVDGRSDLYSLGATLFALVTGHPPFRGSTAQKLMQHQLAEPPKLTKLKGVVPPALSEVVAKMLAKKVSERYQSAGEVIDALSPWLPAPTTGNVARDPVTQSDFTVAGAQSAGSLRRAEPGSTGRLGLTAAPGGKRWPLVAGSGVALFALAGALAFVFWPSPASPPQVAGRGVPPVTTAPQPPAPAAPPLFALNLASVTPTARTMSGGEFVPDWWRGWSAGAYLKGSSAEVAVTQDGGRPCLAVRTLEGPPCGMLFTPSFRLPPGSSATLRLRYKTGSAGALVKFFPADPEGMAEPLATLPPTGGEWRDFEAPFSYSGVSAGKIEFHHQGQAGQPALLVESLEVSISGRPVSRKSAAGALHFEVNLQGIRPFKATFQDGKFANPADAPATNGIVTFFCWRPESVAEFRAVEDGGRIAVGMTNLNDAVSAQFVIDPELGGARPLDRAKKYLARIEYRADNDAVGNLHFRSAEQKTNYKSFNEVALPGTGGVWKTVELPMDPPPSGPLQFVIDNTSVGEGNILLLRRLEVVEAK